MRGKNSFLLSSNVNEVTGAVLNIFIIFFYKKISHAQIAQKAYKRTKIKKGSIFYALKKYLRGKKSLICVFVLLLGCVFVLFVRVKSFCKTKKFKTALMT